MKLTVITAMAFSAVATIASAHDIRAQCEAGWIAKTCYMESYITSHENDHAASAANAAQSSAPTGAIPTTGGEVRVLNQSSTPFAVQCRTSRATNGAAHHPVYNANITLNPGKQVSCYTPVMETVAPAVVTSSEFGIQRLIRPAQTSNQVNVLQIKNGSYINKVISNPQYGNTGGVPRNIR